jgi:hypothetical protein
MWDFWNLRRNSDGIVTFIASAAREDVDILQDKGVHTFF